MFSADIMGAEIKSGFLPSFWQALSFGIFCLLKIKIVINISEAIRSMGKKESFDLKFKLNFS